MASADFYSQREAQGNLDSAFSKPPRNPPITLNTGTPLDKLVREVLKALAKANDPAQGEPRVYVRGGKLAQVSYDENDRPTVTLLRRAGLAVEIARVVQFEKTLKSGVSRVYPQDAVVGAVLEAEEFPLMPPLAGITEVPVVRPDGSILDKPGYDVATRLLYVWPDGDAVRWMPVPESPTDEQLRDAWKKLHYVYADFPFQSPADRANLMGLLVTLVLRPAIAGHIPLAAVDAPTGGTGKGLLVGVTAKIGTGGAAEMLPEGENEAEWRKRITSALLAGRSFTCIDNVEKVLDSATLALMLTAEVYEDRVLGANTMARIPGEQVGVWCATGNNIALGGTMPRRSYRVRLDARVANPYLRSTFQQPRLLEWVGENRMEILRALLIVCRAWFARGKPTKGAPPLGSFERWAEMVAGVLSLDPTRVDPDGPDTSCYGEHFLENGPELWAQGDGDADEWEPFLRALAAAMESVVGREPFTVKKVTDVIRAAMDEFTEYGAKQSGRALIASLPGSLAALVKDDKFSVMLGHALKKHKDTRYGDEMWRVESAGADPHTKMARWVVRHG